ncbi:MAG: substrate-binding periplasmic protein [Bdellovibrionales bacterium]
MRFLLVITLIIACAALYLGVANKPGDVVVEQEPVYANVVKNRTIRCAYVPFKPLTIKDPNTGELSGIFVDLLNDLAARLAMKIDWVEEVTYATVNSGFQTRRYDAFCTGLWPGATRAHNTLFSEGLFYDPVGVFVRANDNRFDDNPYKLNDAAYTVAYTEGDGTEAMAKTIFPLAKKLPLGPVGDGEYYQNIITGKADMAMATKLNGVQFSAENPGQIKEVPSDKPIRMYPVTIGLPEGEYGLKKMLDAVIFEAQDDGTVERVIKKYLGPTAGMLYRQQQTYVPF